MNIRRTRGKRVSLAVSIVILLVLLSCIFINSLQGDKAKAAVINNADIIETDLLLDKNYRGKKSGDYVFNLNALNALYDKILGKENATFGEIDTAANVAKANYSADSVKAIHSGMNSQDIRNKNNNRNIVVKLDGKEWIVTTLTTADNGHVVLTLMLKDVAYNSKWGNWVQSDASDFSATYPATMYSTSYIRAGLLNGSVQYTTNGSVLSSLSDSEKENLYGTDGFPFDIFTNTSEQGNITNFIISPNEVEYQQNENSYDINQGLNYWHSSPNDAALNEISENKWYSSVVSTFHINEMQKKNGYFDWGNDKLWLPSLSETGQGAISGSGVNKNGGLWALDDQQRGVSAGKISWLRSGSAFNARGSYSLNDTGCHNGITVTDVVDATGGTVAVRPAFNLDLTAANDSAFIPMTTPTDISSTYDGEEQDYLDATGTNKWYNEDLFSSANGNVKVEYLNSDGSALSTAKPIDSGEYKVKLTVQNSSKYVWANCKSETEIKFKINQKQLGVDFDVSTTPPKATPTNLCTRDSDLKDSILRIKYTTNAGYSDYAPPAGIDVYKAEVEIDTSVSNNYVLDDTYNIKYIAVPTLTTSTWYTYNGNERAYDISYGHTSDEVEIEISVPSEYNGLVTYSNNEIRVKKAGKYKVAVNIKKKDGTVNWSSRDRDEKYIEFEINQSPFELEILSGGSNNVEITEGEKATVEIDSMVDVFAGDVLNFDVYATKNGTTTERLVYSGLTIDENTNFPLSIDLDTEGLSAASYTLELRKAGDSNSNGDYDITIGNAPITLIVNEMGVSSNIRWTFRRDGKDIDSFNQSTSMLNATYGGSIEYNGSAVIISVRAGKLTFDESYGYVTTVQSTNNSAPMTNADTYTTSVRLLDENNKAEIYTLTWTIDKAKFDLTNVQWKGNGKLEYNGQTQEMVLENLPNKLVATYGGDDTYRDVTTSPLHVTVDYLDFADPSDEDNYILPDINDPTTYKGSVVWETDWNIVPKEIKVQWGKELLKDKNNSPFNIPILRNKADNSVVVHTYYKTDENGNKIGGAISESDIVVPETGTEHYICELSLSNSNGYVLVGETTRRFEVFNQGTAVKFTPNKLTFAYTGKDVMLRFSNNSNLKSDQYDIKYYDANGNEMTGIPKEVGKYKVRIELKPELSGYFIGGDDEWEIEIVARVITESWNTTSKPPRLNINKTELGMIEYEFADSDGNVISYEQVKSAAGDYKVRAKIKGEYANNCSFTSGIETGWQSFKLEEKDLANMQDPNDPTLYPDDPDMQEPEEPDDNNPSGDVSGDVSTNPEDKGGVDFDKISKILKEWWQVIASGISIVLIIIFTCKGASNLSKAKKAKKATENRYKAYYAAATGLFGLAMNTWTIIASVLMGLAVASLVFMILTKVKLNKAQEEMEEARYDYERHKETNRREYDDNRREEEYRRRDEDEKRREEDYRRLEEEYRRRDEEYRKREEEMKSMFMRMMGGNFDGINMGQPQGAYAGVQQGIGAEEIRGIVSETVTALLPGMQQAIPQQASVNEEVIKSLIDGQKAIMQKLTEQPTQAVEKEVVASNANDELIKSMIEEQKAMREMIKQLADRPQQVVPAQPQVIEKIVEKPVEKIVEKEVRVEVPVETVVEKVVEKPIVISTEAVGEVEKSKQVKKTSVPKKAPAPRLTLEEAYAKLTKEQKKYFDGLREYAMSKDSKCKEKLSTYFTTIGPSTTNPFIKLTIKKGITVALFKMEDEYLKDIRRNASSDGTKMKIKETELPVVDKQAYDTAKDMVDLRIDQIDRYNDYLKEQRAMKRK